MLDSLKDRLEAATLIPASGGVFEVRLDGSLVYSKEQTGKFPAPGEVLQAVQGLMDASRRPAG